MPASRLFFGDNLEVLRLHVADESVNLMYLGPPFKSNQRYNVSFQERVLTSACRSQPRMSLGGEAEVPRR